MIKCFTHSKFICIYIDSILIADVSFILWSVISIETHNPSFPPCPIYFRLPIICDVLNLSVKDFKLFQNILHCQFTFLCKYIQRTVYSLIESCLSICIHISRIKQVSLKSTNFHHMQFPSLNILRKTRLILSLKCRNTIFARN